MRASVARHTGDQGGCHDRTQSTLQRHIAHRAYELYTQRGCEPGKDIEDWVRAEKELAGEVVVGPSKTMAA